MQWIHDGYSKLSWYNELLAHVNFMWVKVELKKLCNILFNSQYSANLHGITSWHKLDQCTCFQTSSSFKNARIWPNKRKCQSYFHPQVLKAIFRISRFFPFFAILFLNDFLTKNSQKNVNFSILKKIALRSFGWK